MNGAKVRVALTGERYKRVRAFARTKHLAVAAWERERHAAIAEPIRTIVDNIAAFHGIRPIGD